MANKPTYEELEQRVKELENETFERKQSEKVLKENELKLRVSEQKLNSILHHSPDIIYRLNPEGEITYVNDIVKGYGYSKEDLIGKNILEFIHPDDRKKATLRINERRTGDRSTKSLEVRLLRKDLAYAHFEAKSRGFELLSIDAEGIYSSEKPEMKSFVGTQGIARDITEHKQAEGALRESEEKYRSMMEAMKDPTYICSPDFRVEYMNPAMVKRTGRDAIGEPCYKVINELDEKCPWCVHNKVQQGESLKTEIASPKDSRSYNISNSPIFHQDGSISKMTIYRDITEHKQAEEALRYFQKAIDSASDAIGMSTPEGRHYYQNKVFTELFGLTIKETDGEQGPPSTVYSNEKTGREVFETIMEGGSWTGEVKMLDKNRKEIDVFLRAYSIKDKKDNVVGLVGVHTDITSRKQAEEALRESEEKFRLLSEQNLLGVIIIQDGFVKYVNKAACETTEYSIEEVLDWKQNEFGKLFHPDHLEFVMEQAQKKQEGAKDVVTHYSYRMLTKSGKVKWVGQYSKTITFEGKTADLITIIDITEQNRAKAALQESEQTLKAILNASPICIGLAKDRIIQWGNKVLYRMLGYEEGSLLGENVRVVYPDDETYEHAGRQLYSELKDNGIGQLETQWVTKDDRVVDCDVYVSPIDPSDHSKGIIMAVVDLTERKLAEGALKEREFLFSQLFEQSTTSMCLYNPDGSVNRVNDEFCKMFGVEEKGIIDAGYNVFKDQAAIDSGIIPLLRDIFEEKNTKHWEINFDIDMASGSTGTPTSKTGKIFIEVFGYPVLNLEGNLEYVVLQHYDITDRKRAEEALEDSEALLAQTGRMAKVGGWAIDTKTLEVTWTEETYRIHEVPLGHKPPLEEAINFFHSDDRPKLETAIKKALEQGEPYDMEVRFITAKGRPLWTHTICKPIIVEGKAVKLTGTFQDITEQKQAEEALRESEEKYRTTLRSTPDTVAISRVEDGRFLELNDGFTRMFGYPREEAIGKTVTELGLYHLPTDRDRLVEALSTQEEANELEFTYRRKDGTLFKGMQSARSIRFGDEDCLISVVKDISLLDNAQKTLGESEGKYRSLFEQAGDYILILEVKEDVGLVITDANVAACEIHGYTREELVGTPISDIDRGLNNEQVRALIDRVMAGESLLFETKHLKKDGTTFPIEVSSTFLDIGEGPPLIISIERDLTNRKRAEEEKKKLQTQLQQAQKIEAIGTLAGGIAHDFNNLLMAIQGRASIMLMNKDSSHPDIKHLKGIEDNIESAADLTRQLLGFARGGKYEVRPTDLNELIKKQNRMFGWTKKEITIRGKYEENPWFVEVDRGQIEQVLLNLYVNAWQAMPGGGDLYLETENVTLDEIDVEPFSIEPGEYVKISVTDTGFGMDKATLEKIFEPFFTTKEMGKSTGLGLASVYGIIKNHGGFIDVHSEKGHGSTFNIYLPASEKEVIEEKKAAVDTLRGTETVLFVDDEDMIIEVAGELFEQLGYKVLTAGSGREAIEAYEKNKEKIDIVLLDMIMPDMSGGDTYDKLKEINPDVKVLLASGYSMIGTATEIMDRGCSGFIQKPFKMKELSQKLREILDDK